MKISLYNNKCESVLDSFEDNSIDNVVTDPPYGLQFMNKKWDYDVPSVELWKKTYRVMKPGATLLCFAGTRTQHRMAINIEDAGFILKDVIMWLYGTGFPKGANISKQLDQKFGTTNLEATGETCPDIRSGNYGNSGGKERLPIMKSIASHDKAKLWDGWKSHALKPAYEPIIMAIKPNEGSYVENALKYGISGLNIDGCKIGIEKNTTHQGRYPANIMLSHHPECTEKCHHDCPIKMLDEQSGISVSSGGSISTLTGYGNTKFPFHNSAGTRNNIKGDPGLGDEGGASRFFYCAKASQAERGNENHHPTVKPIKLMEYLCMLISNPECNLYLDPFMGSGTTGIAVSNLGFDFIGIEKDKAYFEIAEKRIGNSRKEEIQIVKRKKLFDNFFE